MQSYLEISQLRFGERMTIQVDVESTAELVLIPTMLLQPLLEKTVKYGIEPSNESGKITLTCNVVDGLLQIKITHPWHQPPLQPQVIQQQESYEMGLQTTKDRLTLLYQEKATLTLENSNLEKSTLTLLLPAQQMEITNGTN